MRLLSHTGSLRFEEWHTFSPRKWALTLKNHIIEHFLVDNMENLHLLPGALQFSDQFKAESPLIRVITLDDVCGPPRLYANINQTAWQINYFEYC
jgi:hypothetical protein